MVFWACMFVHVTSNHESTILQAMANRRILNHITIMPNGILNYIKIKVTRQIS